MRGEAKPRRLDAEGAERRFFVCVITMDRPRSVTAGVGPVARPYGTFVPGRQGPVAASADSAGLCGRYSSHPVLPAPSR
jgi:hypothetical protein